MRKRIIIFIVLFFAAMQTTVLSADKINAWAINEDGSVDNAVPLYDFDGNVCMKLTDAAIILKSSVNKFNVLQENNRLFVKSGEDCGDVTDIKTKNNNKKRKVEINIDGEKYVLSAYVFDETYYFTLSDIAEITGCSVGYNYRIPGITMFDKNNNVAAVLLKNDESMAGDMPEIVDGNLVQSNVVDTMSFSVDPSKPMIALTFDDGPRRGSTDIICNALKECGGHATFFVVGSRVQDNSDLIKMEYDTGCQIGNHSFSHVQISGLSVDQIKTEINKTSNAVYDVCGTYTYIGRPPYGSVSDNVRKATSIEWFNWSVDTLDWKYKDENYVYNYVLQNIQDGDVVLLHDLHETTGRALAKAIPELAKKFQLVTIDEMAQAKGGYENVKGYIRKQ